MLIDDVPVVGENHAGGEIGHISIDPEGPPCPCGKRGCLERLISSPVLEARMREYAGSRQTILEQAGVHLANALAMPVGMLDITDICVYGPPDIVNSDFINAAQRYLDQTTASSFHAPDAHPQVRDRQRHRDPRRIDRRAARLSGAVTATHR